MIVNSNIAALNAQRNLNSSQAALGTSLQRLSSGLRINSAKDDAAGLAIATRMEGQLRGTNQAARNANDAISLAQTAEGGLANITEAIQRIRELAVQSANATNSASDRAALNAEATQLKAEVNRVATTTQFNGLNLLDGSLGSAQFQVGANAGQTIDLATGDVQTTVLGDYRLDADTGAFSVLNPATAAPAPPANRIVAHSLSLDSTVGTNTINISAGQSVKSVADSFNAISSMTGITARAETLAGLRFLAGPPGTITFTLRGTGSAFISTTITTLTDLSPLTIAINTHSATTGIFASTASGRVMLSNAEGIDISVADFTKTSAGIPGAMRLEGFHAFTQSLVGSASLFLANDSSTTGGTLRLHSDKFYNVTPSIANAGLFNSASPTASALIALSTADISTVAGAEDTLSITDGALAQVNSLRANLGAAQNRFEATISNLQTSAENLSASRSRILDADFAAETTALARSQIIQQSGIAVLAQANVSANHVLKLLTR